MRNLKTRSIAIVDDHPSVCLALQRLVWAHGIDSEVFFSGRDFLDALETVPSFQPRCVILDVHMPAMHGLEVLKRLSSVRPDLPVLFLTASAVDFSRDDMSGPQVVGCFRKPLHDDLAVFMNTLHRVVGLDST